MCTRIFVTSFLKAMQVIENSNVELMQHFNYEFYVDSRKKALSKAIKVEFQKWNVSKRLVQNSVTKLKMKEKNRISP